MIWSWELADMFNQLMVIPNAIALFAMSGVVAAMSSRNTTMARRSSSTSSCVSNMKKEAGLAHVRAPFACGFVTKSI